MIEGDEYEFGVSKELQQDIMLRLRELGVGPQVMDVVPIEVKKDFLTGNARLLVRDLPNNQIEVRWQKLPS